MTSPFIWFGRHLGIVFIAVNGNKAVFMARRAIPMIAFPQVRTIYIYILGMGDYEI